MTTPDRPMGTNATAGARNQTPIGRLGPGELRQRVAAFLSERTDIAFTANEVARALGGRSSGAVGNALRNLAGQGHVARTATRPDRYKATSTTARAAHVIARPPTTSSPSHGAYSASGPVRGPVRRPNGQMYQPRLLADMADVAALCRLREANIAALLYGPPGTGKTSLVEAAFPDLITVAGDGDTTVADFVGEYTQTDDGRYEFVYGPLVVAMTEGRCLFIDDAPLIPPKGRAVAYPAMDGRRQIAVKAHKGEIVAASAGF